MLASFAHIFVPAFILLSVNLCAFFSVSTNLCLRFYACLPVSISLGPLLSFLCMYLYDRIPNSIPVSHISMPVYISVRSVPVSLLPYRCTRITVNTGTFSYGHRKKSHIRIQRGWYEAKRYDQRDPGKEMRAMTHQHRNTGTGRRALCLYLCARIFILASRACFAAPASCFHLHAHISMLASP